MKAPETPHPSRVMTGAYARAVAWAWPGRARHKAIVVQPESAAGAPSDPWQHRSKHMRCKTCMWFAPKQNEVGRCRRHAPSMNGYPVVFVTDWCGDHKLNEEAAR